MSYAAVFAIWPASASPLIRFPLQAGRESLPIYDPSTFQAHRVNMGKQLLHTLRQLPPTYSIT